MLTAGNKTKMTLDIIEELYLLGSECPHNHMDSRVRQSGLLSHCTDP